jgi:hypothetical protein
MRFKKLTIWFLMLSFGGIIYVNLTAFEDGIVGYTKKTEPTFGCGCHGLDSSPGTLVEILGPSQVAFGQTATFQLRITRLGMNAGGTDIAAKYGEVYVSPLDTSLRRDSTNISLAYELTHRYPKLDQSDTVIWTFQYQAPLIGVIDTIFANGNAVDNDGHSENDFWNWAASKVINLVVGIEGNSNVVSNFKLNQNYPNPFNPVTKISFNLYKPDVVSLSLFDISGKEIAKLINNVYYQSGEQEIVLDASRFNLSSGIYFYKLQTSTNSEVKKMVLNK